MILLGMDGFFPAKSGSSFRLFQKGDKIFFTIHDSPPKEIYILHAQNKKFLVFENLRGHIKNKPFIENLKTQVFKKIKLKDFPVVVEDWLKYEKNYHIKIPLNNNV